jgi:hypothetical protein
VVAGLTLVLATASDAVSTLVTTRRRPGRFWPTPVFYRQTWRAWMAVGRRARPELREGFLGIYGPLSLLGLLVLWVLLLVAGWGAVWWGLRSRTSGIDGYIDAVYFAGVGFLTVGFGDIVPTGDLARLLVLVEAFMGLVTMALSSATCPPCTAPTAGGRCNSSPWTTSPTRPSPRSGSWRPAMPAVGPRRWRRCSPSGSGGATTCTTATRPTRCSPCSAPGSRASTG